MSYTVEQLEEFGKIKSELYRTGHPTVSLRMELLMEQGVPFDEVLKVNQERYARAVKPEVPVVDLPPPPTKNATNAKWRAFAKKVSDMEPEVIDSMGRTDIRKILVDKGIID